MKKFLIRYSRQAGWLCQLKEDSKCDRCKTDFSEGNNCLYLEGLGILLCEKCFKIQRETGKLWNFGSAYPAKLVKELPGELDEGKEW